MTNTVRILLACATAGALATVMGCPSEDEGPPPIHVDIAAECENLEPGYCMLPWPSSRYLTADSTTTTGWRVDYVSESFAFNERDDVFDVGPYNAQDGFPPSAQIITTFGPAIDITNLPPYTDYDASLAADSPTVLLDMLTGERVAHFAESDVRFDDPDQVMFYIRPAHRLEENRRYAVAIRDIQYVDGTTPAPSEVFAALRDGTVTDAEQVEARRGSFEELFTALDDAGVGREDLILAWDFHTAAGETLWGDMIHIRDDALQRIGPDGLGCTITSVQDDYNADIYRLIQGTVTVPLYMESESSPTRMARGADGLPEYQGDVEIEFWANIPRSLEIDGAGLGRLTMIGHGFFDTGEAVTYGWERALADDHQLVTVGADWQGMATEDLVTAAVALSNVSEFVTVTDRLHQGMLNFTVIARTIAGVCSEDPAFRIDGELVFDPDEIYYTGASQGGIFGGTLMGVSPDISRGALNVPGAIYPLMQTRSTNFDEFELIYAAWYEDRIDREFYWPLMGHLFDKVDPITYLPHLLADPLPGTPTKHILYQAGTNDSQVCNLSTEVAARTAGLVLITPSVRDVWGLEEAPAGPFDGSALQYWDCGAAPVPPNNQPPPNNCAHGWVRGRASCQDQTSAFFHPSGQVENFCDGDCGPDEPGA